jgi:molybdate transport repressor ModE-like protein
MKLTIKGELIIETESGLRISPRLIELLKLTHKTGSLNLAVKEMGFSYSHAWNSIYKINCQTDEPILVQQRGGKGGGVAFLTQSGLRLIRQYDDMVREFEQFLARHTVDLSE